MSGETSESATAAGGTSTVSGSTLLGTILNEHQAGEVVSSMDKHQTVIQIDSETTPKDAADLLWKHNILGVPVWDESKKQYVGFFDMRDILSTVLDTIMEARKQHQQKPQSEQDDGDTPQFDRSTFDSIFVKTLTESGGSSRVSVRYLSARNPFYSCTPESTLKDVGAMIIKHDCHRVPILCKESLKCRNIISQSALVKFLSDQIDARHRNAESKEQGGKESLPSSSDEKKKPGSFRPHREDSEKKRFQSYESFNEEGEYGTLYKQTLDEANFPYRKDVVMVADETTALEAFRKLEAKRLSGLAVVDEDGKLVGNTSASDIKMVAGEFGKGIHLDMNMDILSYLAALRQATPMKKERYPACHVHEDSSVAHVVNLLATTGYHRVFVVDGDNRPVGVISVADVIRYAIGQK